MVQTRILTQKQYYVVTCNIVWQAGIHIVYIYIYIYTYIGAGCARAEDRLKIYASLRAITCGDKTY